MACWEKRAIEAGHHLRSSIEGVLCACVSVGPVSIADVVLALVANPDDAYIPAVLGMVERADRLMACNGFILCANLLSCNCEATFGACSHACRKHTSAVILVALGRQIDLGTQCHTNMHACKLTFAYKITHMRRNANVLRTYKDTLGRNLNAA